MAPLRQSTRNCTLLPPWGVRRHPAISSPRTSPTVRFRLRLRYIAAAPPLRPAMSSSTRIRCRSAMPASRTAVCSSGHQRPSSGATSSKMDSSEWSARPGGSGIGSSTNGSSACAAWKRRTPAGRTSEPPGPGGGHPGPPPGRTPITNNRGRLCGVNHRASTTARSTAYPSSAIRLHTSNRSRPPRDDRNPVTFSSSRPDGASRRRHCSASRSRKGHTVPECFPARPARLPASDRSVHGKEAVTASRSSGRSWTARLLMSSTTKSPAPNRARYISALPGAISFANTHSQPSGATASRTRPMPAKNSANLTIRRRTAPSRSAPAGPVVLQATLLTGVPAS